MHFETLTQIRIELGRLGEKMDALKESNQIRYLEQERRIKKLEDTQTWLWRTTITSFITGAAAIVFALIQKGLGG